MPGFCSRDENHNQTHRQSTRKHHETINRCSRWKQSRPTVIHSFGTSHQAQAALRRSVRHDSGTTQTSLYFRRQNICNTGEEVTKNSALVRRSAMVSMCTYFLVSVFLRTRGLCKPWEALVTVFFTFSHQEARYPGVNAPQDPQSRRVRHFLDDRGRTSDRQRFHFHAP